MAAISSIIAGVTAAAALAGTATSIAAATKKPKQAPAPTFNKEAEEKKAAEQEAEANKRRIMSETDTIKTSALGNTGTTELKKKTLLGG